MSFVDELNKTSINNAQQQIDDEMLDVCVGAIQKKCLSSKDERLVKGYIYWYNDDGYGLDGGITTCLPRKLTNKELSIKHSYLGERSLYNGFPHYYFFNVSTSFENKLRKELSNLGFSNYTVSINLLEDETQIISSGFLGPKVQYKRNGKLGKCIYVEIRW